MNDINDVDLGASAVSGTLSVTADGAITDSGVLAVSGTTTLAAGAGNDITLNNADNFSTVTIVSGDDVTLNDINSVNVGGATVAGDLLVTAGGAVTQSGAIEAAGLGITAAGAVTLNGNNDVDVVAALVTGAGHGFSFRDVDGVTVGTVGGIAGITTVNGAITLSMDALEVGQAIDSGTARTTIQPTTAGLEIDSGTETAGKLSLTDAELDLVTAGALQIGNSSAGAIEVSAPITLDPAKVTTLSLRNHDHITDAGSGAIQVENLGIISAGPVILDGDNDVDRVAADVILDFFIRDDNGYVVDTVDGVSGLSEGHVQTALVGPIAHASIGYVNVRIPFEPDHELTSEWRMTAARQEELAGTKAIWTSSLQVPFSKERTRKKRLTTEEQSRLNQWPLGRLHY